MVLYTREQLIEKLRDIEKDAYGWHINERVLGIDVSDFENIMHQAACMLGAEKIATGEEDPIDRKELLRLIDTQTGANTAFKPQVVYGINVAKSIVSKMPTIRR